MGIWKHHFQLLRRTSESWIKNTGANCDPDLWLSPSRSHLPQFPLPRVNQCWQTAPKIERIGDLHNAALQAGSSPVFLCLFWDWDDAFCIKSFFTYLRCLSLKHQVEKLKTSSTNAERPQRRCPAVPQVLCEGPGSMRQHPVTQTRGLWAPVVEAQCWFLAGDIRSLRGISLEPKEHSGTVYYRKLHPVSSKHLSRPLRVSVCVCMRACVRVNALTAGWANLTCWMTFCWRPS